MAATLDLTVEYYHLPRRAGVTEKEFERRGLDWSVPRRQAALVLVDVWGEHYVASHVERTRGIVLERILPLVDACRRAGVCVVHAPSPDCARRYAQWGRWETSEKRAQDGSDWPPPAFKKKEGEHAAWARPQDPPDAEFDRIIAERHIQAEAVPREGDEVVASGTELQRLCADRGILFLFYAGFAANMCVPFRDYGMRAMKARGYEVVLLEDCTTAIEVGDTAAGLDLSRAATIDAALNIGCVTTAARLEAACV